MQKLHAAKAACKKNPRARSESPATWLRRFVARLAASDDARLLHEVKDVVEKVFDAGGPPRDQLDGTRPSEAESQYQRAVLAEAVRLIDVAEVMLDGLIETGTSIRYVDPAGVETLRRFNKAFAARCRETQADVDQLAAVQQALQFERMTADRVGLKA